jgi:hypothetical protein
MNHPLPRRTAFLLFALVVVTWGLNWAVTKTIVHSVVPLWATAIRSAIATATLFVLQLARGQFIIPRRGDRRPDPVGDAMLGGEHPLRPRPQMGVDTVPVGVLADVARERGARRPRASARRSAAGCVDLVSHRRVSLQRNLRNGAGLLGHGGRQPRPAGGDHLTWHSGDTRDRRGQPDASAWRAGRHLLDRRDVDDPRRYCCRHHSRKKRPRPSTQPRTCRHNGPVMTLPATPDRFPQPDPLNLPMAEARGF